MIDKKKQYTFAMLSATSIIYAAGNGIIANADGSTGVVTANVLNVRSGPSTSNSKIGSISKGKQVKIISSQNGWYEIEYNGGYGWVSGDYISIGSSSNNQSDSTTSTKRVTATCNLNVRSGGSTSYRVVGCIKSGASVDVIGVASSGWYKVRLSNGTIGYASNKYLVESSNESNGSDASNNSANSGSTTNLGTLYTTHNLNMRSGPSTSYSVITTIPNGTEVSVIEHTNSSWYKVKLSNGKTGYCSSSYLSSSKPSNDNNSSSQGSTNINGYEISKTLNVKAYAYCSGSITATGTVPTAGRTIAVDSSVIPMGSKVYIPAFDKVFIAEDRGGAIKGNKIDIYMNTSTECYNWGVRNITIHVLK